VKPPRLSWAITRPAVWALVLAAALGASPLPAQETTPEPVEPPRPTERWGDLISVFSGDLHVPRDVRQRGALVCIGGDVVIDGEVTRDVVVVLGTLELNGTVEGQVVGAVSDLRLRDATVDGALINVAGDLEIEDSAVRRDLVSVLGKLDRDELTRVAGRVTDVNFDRWIPSLWALLFWMRLFHKFVLFVLVVVLALLLPERIRTMGEEAPLRYVAAFFTGLAAYVVLLLLLVPLLITVVGVFLAAFLVWVLKWLGICAIFYAIGRRLGRAAGFAPSVLGSVLLVFAVFVVLSLAPMALGFPGLLINGVLGFVFLLLVSVPGLGLVILSRFGRRRWNDGVAPPPAVEPTLDASV